MGTSCGLSSVITREWFSESDENEVVSFESRAERAIMIIKASSSTLIWIGASERVSRWFNDRSSTHKRSMASIRSLIAPPKQCIHSLATRTAKGLASMYQTGENLKFGFARFARVGGDLISPPPGMQAGRCTRFSCMRAQISLFMANAVCKLPRCFCAVAGSP